MSRDSPRASGNEHLAVVQRTPTLVASNQSDKRFLEIDGHVGAGKEVQHDVIVELHGVYMLYASSDIYVDTQVQ